MIAILAYTLAGAAMACFVSVVLLVKKDAERNDAFWRDFDSGGECQDRRPS